MAGLSADSPTGGFALQAGALEAPGMRIEIPLYEGFDEVDAIAPFEVLANAAVAVDGLEVELVGAYGPGEVVAGHGARFALEHGLSDAPDFVLVPGGGWISGGG